MHEYLMEYDRYFGHDRRFQVLATNREEAMRIGNERLNKMLDRDDIIPGTLRVIRKLKPSFGEPR